MPSKAMAIARRRRETRASPSLQAKVRRSAALRSWRIGRDTIGVARDKMSPESQNHNLGPTATFSTSRVTFFRLWYQIPRPAHGIWVLFQAQLAAGKVVQRMLQVVIDPDLADELQDPVTVISLLWGKPPQSGLDGLGEAIENLFLLGRRYFVQRSVGRVDGLEAG